jgi:iron complex outermembrane recepter protein
VAVWVDRAIAAAPNTTTNVTASPDNPTAATSISGNNNEGQLQEVVVTATRRETNLEKTPISVSAIGASDIAEHHLEQVSDIAAFVPNFSAARAANFNVASFAIRGVADTQVILYTQPPVATIVDDFVVPRVDTTLLDTFDLQQVQVLRGPQGTLFGKNTTGGAVVLTTKRPELDALTLDAVYDAGSFGTRDYKFAVNVPIGNTLAFRGVMIYDYSSGYYKNGACYGPIVSLIPSAFDGAKGCGDGSTLGGTNTIYGRGKLLWEPSASLDALLQYEIIRDRSDSVTGVNITPPGEGLELANLGFPAAYTGHGDPLNYAGSDFRNSALLNIGQGNVVNVDGLYLTANWHEAFGTFTSVSGWREQTERLPSDYTNEDPVAHGQALSLFDSNRADDRFTWQQEIRFASKSDGPFSYVSGAFYQVDYDDFCIDEVLGFLDLTGPALPFGTWNNNPYMLCSAQNAKSAALYGDTTYKFTDRFSVSAGARYTWDDKTWWGRQQVFIQQLDGGFNPNLAIGNPLAANVFAFPQGVVEITDKRSEPTWRFSADYQLTPDIFTFANYARGFKSGGFNDQIGSFHPFVNANGSDNDAAFEAAAAPPKPELADSFELGEKAELFDKRLRANITAFYVNYRDLQRQIITPLDIDGATFQVTRYFNAAEARVWGIETEIAGRPLDGLTLQAIVGYENGKYNKYITPIPAGYDLATNPLDRTPTVNATGDAMYDLPLSYRGLHLTFDANINYVARNLFAESLVSPSQNTYLNARALTNASITLTTGDDRFYVRFVGQNLSDKRYLVSQLVVAGLWENEQFGPPRYLGIQVGAQLGHGNH